MTGSVSGAQEYLEAQAWKCPKSKGVNSKKQRAHLPLSKKRQKIVPVSHYQSPRRGSNWPTLGPKITLTSLRLPSSEKGGSFSSIFPNGNWSLEIFLPLSSHKGRKVIPSQRNWNTVEEEVHPRWLSPTLIPL